MNIPPLRGYENMNKLRLAIQSNFPAEEMMAVLEKAKESFWDTTKQRVERSNISLETIAAFVREALRQPDPDSFFNKQLDDWNAVVNSEYKNGYL